MKLQLNKIVEVLSKIKDDEFYFKNYAPEIIESYADEISIDFSNWIDKNYIKKKGVYYHRGDWEFSNGENNKKKLFQLFKGNRNNLT